MHKMLLVAGLFPYPVGELKRSSSHNKMGRGQEGEKREGKAG